MTRVCLQFVIVVYPDHTHSLFCFSLLLLFIYFVCDLPYCLSVSGLLVFRILLLFIILVWISFNLIDCCWISSSKQAFETFQWPASGPDLNPLEHIICRQVRSDDPPDESNIYWKWRRCVTRSCRKFIEPRHEVSNNVAFWQVKTQTSLCSLFLNLEIPNAAR